MATSPTRAGVRALSTNVGWFDVLFDQGEAAMPEEAKTETQPQQQAQAAPQQVPFQVDTSQLSSTYTNWYRVTGTPEELILDFGLNPQMGQAPTEAIKLTHRLVMNFYTAKRLLNALHFA